MKKLLYILAFLITPDLCHGTNEFGFGTGKSLGFIYNPQSPIVDINYGEGKTRRYELDLTNLGLMAQLAFSFHFIFFFGTDQDFFEKNKPIELGWGATLSTYLPVPVFLNGLVTYIKIKNNNGHILLISLPIGVTLDVCPISLIPTGGKLTPLTEQVQGRMVPLPA